MATTKNKPVYISLPMEPEAVDALDAEISLLEYETSRASAIRTILKAWTATQARKRARKARAS